MNFSKNILLLFLSIGLVATWVYHFYEKTYFTKKEITNSAIKDSLAIQQAKRDSFQKLFVEKNAELTSTKQASDSLRIELDSSLATIAVLSTEINNILKNNHVSRGDLKKARDLLSKYKNQVEDIRSMNNSMEAERTRLNSVLVQLDTETESIRKEKLNQSASTKPASEVKNTGTFFNATNLQFSAVSVKPVKQKDAAALNNAGKLSLSFTLQNNTVRTAKYDMYLVITQPGNKIIQNDEWGDNYFVLKNGGKKAFTKKIQFNYTRGERKKLNYSVQSENFQPGIYRLQLYQNGLLIGEVNKKLG